MVALLPGAARQAQTAPASPIASPSAATALSRAVAYLVARQAGDGSFPGYSGKPDAGATADAAVALATARAAGIDVGASLAAAIGHLQSQAATYAAQGEGQAAKIALAALAAGVDPSGSVASTCST